MTDPIETTATEGSVAVVAEIPPPPKVPVWEAFAALQRDVQSVAKDQRNEADGFNYRGIDGVLNAVGPAQRRHGVFFLPKVLSHKTVRYRTDKGVGIKSAEVEVEYTIIGPNGDTMVGGSALGDASDEGDQCLQSAQSVAFKVFLLTAMTMPTERPDPDGTKHRRAARDAEADDARKAMTALLREHAVDAEDLKKMHADAVQEFSETHGGIDIRDCLDPRPIQALTEEYRARLATVDADS